MKKETLIELGKFSVLWSIFEAEKCENKCTDFKLKNISITFKEEDYYNLFKLVKTTLTDYLLLGQMTSELNEQVINERLYSNGYTLHPEVRKVLLENEYSHKILSEAVMYIVYRIRNNFFHGRKDMYSINNQKALFQSINNLLEKIVKFKIDITDSNQS